MLCHELPADDWSEPRWQKGLASIFRKLATNCTPRAIGFSILIEPFNQIARRNFIKQQSNQPLRARTADAILRLMGGRRQVNVQADNENRNPVPVPWKARLWKKNATIDGVLSLASRSLRGIMTPRGEISWVDANLSVDEIRQQLAHRHTACSRSAGVSWMRLSVWYARKRCWWRWKSGVNVEGAALVPRRPPSWYRDAGSDQPAGRIASCRKRFVVIVTNEFACVQGPSDAALDVLEAIAGEFPDADETPEIVADGDGWLVSAHRLTCTRLSHTLGVEKRGQ